MLKHDRWLREVARACGGLSRAADDLLASDPLAPRPLDLNPAGTGSTGSTTSDGAGSTAHGVEALAGLDVGAATARVLATGDAAGTAAGSGAGGETHGAEGGGETVGNGGGSGGREGSGSGEGGDADVRPVHVVATGPIAQALGAPAETRPALVAVDWECEKLETALGRVLEWAGGLMGKREQLGRIMQLEETATDAVGRAEEAEGQLEDALTRARGAEERAGAAERAAAEAGARAATAEAQAKDAVAARDALESALAGGLDSKSDRTYHMDVQDVLASTLWYEVESAMYMYRPTCIDLHVHVTDRLYMADSTLWCTGDSGGMSSLH